MDYHMRLKTRSETKSWPEYFHTQFRDKDGTDYKNYIDFHSLRSLHNGKFKYVWLVFKLPHVISPPTHSVLYNFCSTFIHILGGFLIEFWWIKHASSQTLVDLCKKVAALNSYHLADLTVLPTCKLSKQKYSNMQRKPAQWTNQFTREKFLGGISVWLAGKQTMKAHWEESSSELRADSDARMVLAGVRLAEVDRLSLKPLIWIISQASVCFCFLVQLRL